MSDSILKSTVLNILMINIKDRRKRQLKYKYSFNSKLYDVNMNSSFDQKVGAARLNPQSCIILQNKSKSNSSLTLEKINNKTQLDGRRNSASNNKKSMKDYLIKLPQIQKPKMLQFKTAEKKEKKEKQKPKKLPDPYYQNKIFKSMKLKEENYLMNLCRQHFIQSIEALKIGKNMKLQTPKEIKVPKKHPKFKTIFLDLDETLVHCDEQSTHYTTKLNFPIEGGGTISAGIRVRPYCQQFIKELSEFAQVIIFTASSASYADVVLNYLDPKKKYFSHRLYRQNCTVQKGFYTKDMRVINRRPQDIAIVDNSAFCFMSQPQHGIPILPFYHYAKDKQLLSLLQYLKALVNEQDMREKIKETFFWPKYLKGENDPRKIFLEEFGVE